jgi:hypothetical protein
MVSLPPSRFSPHAARRRHAIAAKVKAANVNRTSVSAVTAGVFLAYSLSRLPYLSASRWRSSIRLILPVSVFGRSGTNSITRG